MQGLVYKESLVDKLPHIAILTAESGDWQGLYINGKLVEEGHRINSRDLSEHLQRLGLATYSSKEIPNLSDGSCPMPPTI